MNHVQDTFVWLCDLDLYGLSVIVLTSGGPGASKSSVLPFSYFQSHTVTENIHCCFLSIHVQLSLFFVFLFFFFSFSWMPTHADSIIIVKSSHFLMLIVPVFLYSQNLTNIQWFWNVYQIRGIKECHWKVSLQYHCHFFFDYSLILTLHINLDSLKIIFDCKIIIHYWHDFVNKSEGKCSLSQFLYITSLKYI